MKVLAFNGSPRKNWNTAQLLGKALEGAASQGAETRLVHLYEHDFKGCVSCFACKANRAQPGPCRYRDGLTSLLEEAAQADALLLGSPIYLGTLTGGMKSFIERLVFPYLSYSESYASVFPGRIKVGAVYTMNITEAQYQADASRPLLERYEATLRRIFGGAESLLSFDTYQFDDYSKVRADRFDAVHKRQRREEVFPMDCQRAFDLGARLAA